MTTNQIQNGLIEATDHYVAQYAKCAKEILIDLRDQAEKDIKWAGNWARCLVKSYNKLIFAK